ncbi:MAG: glycoside hydrolase family 25 protein, partial [Phycicoccus sp.]
MLYVDSDPTERSSPAEPRPTGRHRARRLHLGIAPIVAVLALLLAIPTPHTARAEPAPAGQVAESTREGIDVGTTQASLDFAAAAREGVSFAVVKTGGSQLSDGPYVSPNYTRQVDAARAAGLTVGHYWLSGDFQTPTQAADYFVDNLHDYRAGDVVALDNEILDDSTRLWGDAEVAAFFTRVKKRLGTIVPWFYVNASDLRSGSWTATIATGAKLWVASWGRNDGTYPGAPDIG